MDRLKIKQSIADLHRAQGEAKEGARHIGNMITKMEADYGVTMTSIYTERSHAAQNLDRALTILRRTYDAGLA